MGQSVISVINVSPGLCFIDDCLSFSWKPWRIQRLAQNFEKGLETTKISSLIYRSDKLHAFDYFFAIQIDQYQEGSGEDDLRIVHKEVLDLGP